MDIKFKISFLNAGSDPDKTKSSLNNYILIAKHCIMGRQLIDVSKLNF